MKIRTLAAFGAAAGLAGLANGALIADATADFGEQGDNGWSYGYTDGLYSSGASFQLFTIRTASTFRHSISDTWTFGNGTAMHSNAAGTSRSDTVQDSVRRWESNVSGEVELTGVVAHAYDDPRGNGTTASIFVDGVEVYSFDVVAGDANGDSYTVSANVTTNSVIEYVVTSNGDAAFDSTIFTAKIDLVEIPAPASVALLGLGGLVATRRRR